MNLSNSNFRLSFLTTSFKEFDYYLFVSNHSLSLVSFLCFNTSLTSGGGGSCPLFNGWSTDGREGAELAGVRGVLGVDEPKPGLCGDRSSCNLNRYNCHKQAILVINYRVHQETLYCGTPTNQCMKRDLNFLKVIAVPIY
jgi:hypothetical protein